MYAIVLPILLSTYIFNFLFFIAFQDKPNSAHNSSLLVCFISRYIPNTYNPQMGIVLVILYIKPII